MSKTKTHRPAEPAEPGELPDDITPADMGALPPDAPAAPAADGSKPPPFGTPRRAKPGEGARVVHELERAAGTGLTRYKIACRNYTPQKTRYLLAPDADAAVACYLEIQGLGKLMAKLKKQAGPRADDVEAPDLVVTTLPD